jgi:aminoglycoside phosphotransferase (APT) family kinase protein
MGADTRSEENDPAGENDQAGVDGQAGENDQAGVDGQAGENGQAGEDEPADGQAGDPRIGAAIARLTASGVLGGAAGDRVARVTALSGGTYNTLAAVELTRGERLVLKIPPPLGAPGLRYERGLLHGEALFYAAAATVGVPAPRVLHTRGDLAPGAEADAGVDAPADLATNTPADTTTNTVTDLAADDVPFVLMTHLPGVTWWSAADGMEERERDRLRESLGRMVARLHGVAGPGFGYPSRSTGAPAGRWAEAFAAMTGAVLDDAERYGAWLPRPAARVRAALAAATPLLAEVTTPALVHFDLWPGNVLVDGPAGRREISGLIDGERMFWGDPLADFASLSLFAADAERDPAFLAGYGAGGGRTVFDAGALRRIALYRCYLYLIMLVEVVPREYGAEHTAWVRTFAGPRLEEALGAAAG